MAESQGTTERDALLTERRVLYRAIEERRGRPLIVYATSTRANLNAQMASDAVREFIDQIAAQARFGNPGAVDVLLHSVGGDSLTAWKLMSILRERYKKVSVLVPYMAFSAATIFALGADEIVMHPNASLGPIDPQITVREGDKIRAFAYEDLGAFLHFLSKEVKLTEQAHFASVVDRLFATVDPVHVGAARRASELSAQVGARLLKLHTKDERRCQQIAQNLNKSFFAHGDAVSRKRAKELELAVVSPDAPLEDLLWDAYLGLEKYMELRKPWNPPAMIFEDQAAAQHLDPIGSLSLPPDMPKDVAMQVYQAAANQALARAAAPAPRVPFRAVIALVESRAHASEVVSEGYLTATRLPDGKIQVSATEKSLGWREVAGPAEDLSTDARKSQPVRKSSRKAKSA